MKVPIDFTEMNEADCLKLAKRCIAEINDGDEFGTKKYKIVRIE